MRFFQIETLTLLFDHPDMSLARWQRQTAEYSLLSDALAAVNRIAEVFQNESRIIQVETELTQAGLAVFEHEVALDWQDGVAQVRPPIEYAQRFKPVFEGHERDLARPKADSPDTDTDTASAFGGVSEPCPIELLSQVSFLCREAAVFEEYGYFHLAEEARRDADVLAVQARQTFTGPELLAAAQAVKRRLNQGLGQVET